MKIKWVAKNKTDTRIRHEFDSLQKLNRFLEKNLKYSEKRN
ncbi:MAG: hypothetical protein [Microvirus sp.]|nr:MAG: hypothetical protein [Microvirus sp.]